MNAISEAQVQAALETAGLATLEQPAAIAASLSALLTATSQAFAAIPFESEPASFSVVLKANWCAPC